VQLIVTDWDANFENNRTRELKVMTWVPVPNKQDGDGYTELIEEHPAGAAHFGAWIAILEVASKCEPRGNLVRSTGEWHTVASLSRISRIPVTVLEEAIPRLIKIGWLTDASISECGCKSSNDTEPQEGAIISQEGATRSQEGAIISQEGATRSQEGAVHPAGGCGPHARGRAHSVPFHSIPFSSVPEGGAGGNQNEPPPDPQPADKPPAPSAADRELWFREFWDAYPRCDRRRNRAKALDVFLRHIRDRPTFDRLMLALRIAKSTRDWQKENMAFVPLPTSWLNLKPWRDVEPPAEEAVRLGEVRCLCGWCGPPDALVHAPEWEGQDEIPDAAYSCCPRCEQDLLQPQTQNKREKNNETQTDHHHGRAVNGARARPM